MSKEKLTVPIGEALEQKKTEWFRKDCLGVLRKQVFVRRDEDRVYVRCEDGNVRWSPITALVEI